MTARLAILALILGLLAPIEACDQRIESGVQGLRRPALEPAMRFATDACNKTTLFGGLLAIALLDGSTGVETARLAVVTLLPTNLLVEGLKRATNRARPDGEHRPSNAAFPSSHAANAFALAVILARRWPRAWPLCLLAALTVAFSRVYLNRHYPSDVICGALIGAGMAWAAAWMRERRRARRAPAAPSGT